jgi:hypothetical protein
MRNISRQHERDGTDKLVGRGERSQRSTDVKMGEIQNGRRYDIPP